MVDRQFHDEFWSVYPARNGKKVGKAAALVEFANLTGEQRRQAVVGARNLAASERMPKDPERFLRRSKGGSFPFEDWQEPERPPPKVDHRVSVFSDGTAEF